LAAGSTLIETQDWDKGDAGIGD